MAGSGADLEYARMLEAAGVDAANSAGHDGAYLEQLGDIMFANTIGGLTLDQLNALIDARVGSVTGGQINVHDPAYGAVGDGVTSDTAAIQEAIDAMEAFGGGEVSLFSFEDSVYLVDGPLTVKENVSLVGDATSLVELGKCTLKLNGATASLTIGNGTARGGYSRGFNIDVVNCDPDYALRLIVVQQHVARITVNNATGVGCLVYASQNTYVHSLDVNNSGTDNVVIDGGTGGMLFGRCEWTSSGPTGWGLKITESDPGGHPGFGYQFGPAHNEFHHCIVEHYDNAGTQGLILIEAGTRQVFRSCGISNSTDDIFASGYQVKITNDCFPASVPTIVEFDGCNFHGGNVKKYPPFFVKGNATFKNVLALSGQTHFQFATGIFAFDGLWVLNIEGHMDFTSVTTFFVPIGGAASLFFARQERWTGDYYKLPASTDPEAAGMYPIMAGLDTDAGARYIVTQEGVIAFASGANFTALATIQRDSNNMVALSSLNVNGRLVETETVVAIPSAGYALVTAVNAGGPAYFFSLEGGTSIASWTVTNPVNNQVIYITVYTAGAQTVVWPVNFRFKGGAPPALTAGDQITLKMKYSSASGLWYERHRDDDIAHT